MRDFRRIGAVGAFVMAFAYIVGMGLAFTVLDAGGAGDPLETVRFHVEN